MCKYKHTIRRAAPTDLQELQNCCTATLTDDHSITVSTPHALCSLIHSVCVSTCETETAIHLSTGNKHTFPPTSAECSCHHSFLLFATEQLHYLASALLKGASMHLMTDVKPSLFWFKSSLTSQSNQRFASLLHNSDIYLDFMRHVTWDIKITPHYTMLLSHLHTWLHVKQTSWLQSKHSQI